jgi:hypothetical protein
MAQPIRVVKNQHRGINAHLHSYWQAEKGWDGFHASHIPDLTRALRAQLLPMRYTAEIEQALQIRRYGEPAGRRESDVTLSDSDPIRSRQPSMSSLTNTNALVMPIPELLGLEEQEVSSYRAIGIYLVKSQDDLDEPVAWIELLSPSNKPGGRTPFTTAKSG